MIKVQCIKCKIIYPVSKGSLTCRNHNPYYGYLEVIYPFVKKLKKQNGLLAKYSKLLCFKPEINFNEQITPLIHLKHFGKKYGLPNIYVKDEGYNPTGSFKDRGSLSVVNKAKEWGITNIHIASSGNAALSIAAYAQKARITCECWISKNITEGKKALLKLYGAKIVQKTGNYEKIYRLAAQKKNSWNVTPGINYLHEEGIKLIGFEIFEQIGVPDLIIVPCGNGSLLFSLYKAFKELNTLQLTSKIPKLIGVQIQGAAPLRMSYLQKKDYVIHKNSVESLAEGIIAEESFSSPKVMKALKETKGEIIEVADTEIISALKEIISLESLIPEFTAASIYAGIKKLQLPKKTCIVGIQTAHGFKNLQEIMEVHTYA